MEPQWIQKPKKETSESPMPKIKNPRGVTPRVFKSFLKLKTTSS
jgi:hypothetical protein